MAYVRLATAFAVASIACTGAQPTPREVAPSATASGRPSVEPTRQHASRSVQDEACAEMGRRSQDEFGGSAMHPVETLSLGARLPKNEIQWVRKLGHLAAFRRLSVNGEIVVVDPSEPSKSRILKTPALGGGFASHSFVDGAVVDLHRGSGGLRALDVTTGGLKWQTSVCPAGACDMAHMTVLRTGDDLVGLFNPFSGNDDLLRINAHTGRIRSRVALRDTVSFLAVADTVAYVYTPNEGIMRAYDADSRELWKTKLTLDAFQLAASSVAVVAVSGNGELRIVDAKTGTLCHALNIAAPQQQERAISTYVTIHGGGLFGVRERREPGHTYRSHVAFAVDLATGNVRWEAEPIPFLDTRFARAEVFTDVDAYHVCHDREGTLRSYDAQTGKLRLEWGLGACDLTSFDGGAGRAKRFISRLRLRSGKPFAVLERGGQPPPLESATVVVTTKDLDGSPIRRQPIIVHGQLLQTDVQGRVETTVTARSGFSVRFPSPALKQGSKTWVVLTGKKRYRVNLKLGRRRVAF